ncbi:MAG: hypothetical protein RIR96_1213 [Bacteroidota bacterium]|jgi:hypothetical protein
MIKQSKKQDGESAILILFYTDLFTVKDTLIYMFEGNKKR